jgi:hypothetical protein
MQIFSLYYSWGSESSLKEIPAAFMFFKLHFDNLVTVGGTKLTTAKLR